MARQKDRLLVQGRREPDFSPELESDLLDGGGLCEIEDDVTGEEGRLCV